jgi:hypothetical protein
MQLLFYSTDIASTGQDSAASFAQSAKSPSSLN